VSPLPVFLKPPPTKWWRMTTKQEEIRASYTKITGILSPYANYLQPDNGTRMLLPYEWVLALVATGMGVYLGTFLKELGKIHAKQFAEFLSSLAKAKTTTEQEDLIIELYCEHIEEVKVSSLESRAHMAAASAKATSELIAFLSTKNFPDDTAARAGAQVAAALEATLRSQQGKES
jgi:hypothetical protein